MPRVVISGPDFIGTCASLARGFEAYGWATSVHTWGDLPSGPLQRVRARLRSRRDGHLARNVDFVEVLRGRVIPDASSERTDLVVIVKPHGVDTSTVASLRRTGVPLAVWATDSLERYPGQTDLMENADLRYAMDDHDASAVAGSWLPLGFDDEIFAAVPEGEPRRHDVLFVGNLFRERYQSRIRYFRALRESEIARRYRVAFAGAALAGWSNRLGWMPGRVDWLGGGLPLVSLASAIARSRVCVNIHQDDGVQPVNPLFFAIPACGACMVTDEREYLGQWLESGVQFLPMGLDDLTDRLEAVLQSGDAVRIAQAGRQGASQHTYKQRVARMLTDLGFEAQP